MTAALTTRWRRWTGAARELLDDRPLVACGLVALLVLVIAAGWGIPHATSEVTVRGWEVDAISGIGVLSEISNLTSPGRADWYVAYPLFHYLVLAIVYAPYLAFAVMTGALSAPGPSFPYGFADPAGAFVVLNAIGHAVSIVMGCVTVMAVFVLARRLSGGKAALLAAALSLCSASFVFYARTGNLDVPALCWTVLALVALERAWTDGLTRSRAMACGALAALAVATKDQSYGVLLGPIFLVLARALSASGKPTLKELRLPAMLVLSGCLVFLVASGVVFRPDRFVRHLDYITSFRDTFTNVRNPTELTVMREATFTGRLLLLGDLFRALGAAIGWPAVVVGFAGMVGLQRAVPAMRLLLVAFGAFFLLVLIPIQHMQYRYALAPAILLAISAAVLITRVARGPVAGAALSAVLVVPALAGAAEVTQAMLTDARYPASAWLREHARSGDTLVFFGRPHQLPYLPEGVHAEAIQEGDPRARLLELNPRWVIVAPDYFADPARERSIFLPPAVYDGLRDGSLGWRRAGRFESPGLLRRPLPYLPYVNPVVQVYERR